MFKHVKFALFTLAGIVAIITLSKWTGHVSSSVYQQTVPNDPTPLAAARLVHEAAYRASNHSDIATVENSIAVIQTCTRLVDVHQLSALLQWDVNQHLQSLMTQVATTSSQQPQTMLPPLPSIH